MKDELTQKLLQYLNGAETFLQSQIPDFVNEYLTWCFYSHLFSIVGILIAFVLSVIFCLVLTKIVFKNRARHFYRDTIEPMSAIGVVYLLSIIISGCLFIATFCVSYSSLYQITMLKTAPKVYLIKSLTKSLE